MEKYNALDNLKMAYGLRTQLILELEDIRASIQYGRDVDNDPMDEEDEYAQQINLLIDSLRLYIGERKL